MNSVPLSALLSLALLASASRVGADEPQANRGASLGMNVQRAQDDFGLGLLFGSPFFFGDTTRLTLGGGIAWYPNGASPSGEDRWLEYGHMRLVVEGGRRLADTPIRLYGFGGVELLILPDRLASNVAAPGGVGGFGFEFYMPEHGKDGPVSYFIELGGIGTGATANHLAGNPILANGFLASVGLRVYP